jgi:hypothetical protein
MHKEAEGRGGGGHGEGSEPANVCIVAEVRNLMWPVNTL